MIFRLVCRRSAVKDGCTRNLVLNLLRWDRMHSSWVAPLGNFLTRKFVLLELVMISAAAFSALATSLLPVLTGRAIDGKLFWGIEFVYLIIANLLLMILANTVQSISSTWLTQDMRISLVSDLYARLFHARLDLKRGKIVSRIPPVLVNEVDTIVQGVVASLTKLVSMLTLLVSAMIGILYISGPGLFLFVSLVVVATIISIFSLEPLRNVASQTLDARKSVIQAVSRLPGTFSMLRLYAADRVDFHPVSLTFIEVRRAAFKNLRTALKYGAVSESMLAVASIILGVHALLYLRPMGLVSDGQIAQLFMYGGILVAPFQAILSTIRDLQMTVAALSRLSCLTADLVYPNDIISDASISCEVGFSIFLQKISVSIEGGGRILDGVSFDVMAGDCLVVTGPSGSGKTTLLNVMAGLVEPTTGRCVFASSFGEIESRLSCVSYVGQNEPLFQDSILQTILLDRSIGETSAFRELDFWGMSRAFIDNHDSIVDSSSLSGGERQRVGLARAFASSRPVMILDEPTSALNDDWKEIFMERVKTSSKTIVIATHDSELLKVAEKFVVLRNGCVVEEGKCDGWSR